VFENGLNDTKEKFHNSVLESFYSSNMDDMVFDSEQAESNQKSPGINMKLLTKGTRRLTEKNSHSNKSQLDVVLETESVEEAKKTHENSLENLGNELGQGEN